MNLPESVAKVVSGKKTEIQDNVTGNNVFYKTLTWWDESKIQGTPQYHERFVQVTDHLNLQREAVREYLALPWYKRLFKKPEYVVYEYGYKR